MADRAWIGWVPDPYGEYGVTIVHAATAGKAKALVASEILGAEGFTGVRVKRVPALDGHPHITDAQALAAGAYGWVECWRCYRRVYEYDLADDACVGQRGIVYCSRACCIAGEGLDD